jgi:Ion channel
MDEMGDGQSAAATVRDKAKQIISDSWESQANLSFFLLAIVLFTFVFPVIGFGETDLKLYADIVSSLMFVSGVAIAWGRPKLLLFAALPAIAAMVLRWADWFNPAPRLQFWADVATIVAVAMIAFVLLAQVLRPGRVTHVRVEGAIAAYLCLGVAWAHGYQIVNALNPAAFHTTLIPLANISAWAYYSFATLTTVGYGDISPVSAVARTVSIGEALTGQLYLAVLIARLVAMEVTSWQDNIIGNK